MPDEDTPPFLPISNVVEADFPQVAKRSCNAVMFRVGLALNEGCCA